MRHRPSSWIMVLLLIGTFFVLPVAITGGEWREGGRIDWYEAWGLVWGIGVGAPALAVALIALIEWEDDRERRRDRADM